MTLEFIKWLLIVQLFARLEARRCLKDLEPRLFPEDGGPDNGDCPVSTFNTIMPFYLLNAQQIANVATLYLNPHRHLLFHLNGSILWKCCVCVFRWSGRSVRPRGNRSGFWHPAPLSMFTIMILSNIFFGCVFQVKRSCCITSCVAACCRSPPEGWRWAWSSSTPTTAWTCHGWSASWTIGSTQEQVQTEEIISKPPTMHCSQTRTRPRLMGGRSVPQNKQWQYLCLKCVWWHQLVSVRLGWRCRLDATRT